MFWLSIVGIAPPPNRAQADGSLSRGLRRPKIEAIAFDLGNTLLPFSLNACFGIYSYHTGLPPYLIDQIFWECIDLLERGMDPTNGKVFEGSREERYQQAACSLFRRFNRRVNDLRNDRGMSAFINPPIYLEQFLRIFNGSVLTFDLDRFRFLEKIRRHYPIAIVTNTNPIHLHYLYRKNPFSKILTGNRIVASCEIGARKPEVVIWEKTIEVLGVEPEECVFVDDNVSFVWQWKRNWRYTRGVDAPGVVSSPSNFYGTMRSLAAMGVRWDGM